MTKYADIKIPVDSTSGAIRGCAGNLRHYAAELERIASRMDDTQDISYVVEALSAIQNCSGNMLLSRLFARPQREYDRVIQALTD